MMGRKGHKPIALDAYEALARHYANLVDTKAENAYYERPATLSLLPHVAGKRVLDAGCGPGSYAEWLIDRGAEVVAFDVSPKMVRLARRRLKKRAEVHLADLSHPLDFLQTGSFDIVLCTLVLDYVREWEAVFGEFNRVLRGFGILVFSAGHPFADFDLHRDGNYFKTELVENEWRGFGIPVVVPCYRRPLSAILSTLGETGFLLERLVEPRPAPELKSLEPRVYSKLSKFPGFVCVRARKATGR